MRYIKRLIVFLTKQIERSAYWDHNVYDLLMDRAQYNIRNLIEVVPFLKAESEFYGAVVLAIYFCEKYEMLVRWRQRTRHLSQSMIILCWGV